MNKLYDFTGISKLGRKELLALLNAYDSYVIRITDRNDGSVPVCVPEFFENDYQARERKLC